MDSKISQFVSQTGADTAVAKDLLQEKNWDVEAAVKVYRFMYNAMPPPGPQKNLEKQTHQQKTISGGGVPPATVKAGMVVGLPPKSDTKPSATAPQSNSKYPALKRGLSKTTENVEIVTKARDQVLQDITEQDEVTHAHLETPEYTFILPDLTKYSEDFRAFLHKDLIETSTLVSLEQAGRLNWWADLGASQRLLPLATTGDGNCLLHAASLAMWGFHDRMLTLRKALFKAMSTTVANSGLYRRWRWQQSQVNKETGLVYTEDEWRTEWTNLLKLASTKPRSLPAGGGGATTSCCDSPATKGLMERNSDDGDVFYESLEEFHVFLLANVLRRPIIVVADNMLKDSNGEALAPIPFGGIYLPLDVDPAQCHRTPLLLTYDASHFSALVAMETETSPEDKTGPPAAIPLVDPGFQLLPMHYHVDPGEPFSWKNVHNPVICKQMQMTLEQRLNLIKRYVSIDQLPISPPSWNSTDSEAGSEPRSRAGSLDSNAEESQNGGGGGGGGSAKEKDKSKAAKQLHSVQKAFGSIGKSMSKKLKKNFGSVGRGVKDGGERARRPSVGSVTQSTKVSSITLEVLKDQKDQNILAVRLSGKRPAYQTQFLKELWSQEDMVKNYLSSAQTRFQQNRELRRQHDVEMKKRAVELHALNLNTTPTDSVDGGVVKEMACINAGCEQRGTAATSWLCPGCYEKEKAQAFNIVGNGGGGVKSGVVAVTGGVKKPEPGGASVTTTGGNNGSGSVTTVVVTSKPPPYQRPPSIGDVDRQNTIMQSGKSKFYTYANEDHTALSKDSGLATHSADLNNMKRQTGGGSIGSGAGSGAMTVQVGKPRSDNPKSTFYVDNVNINKDTNSVKSAGSATRSVTQHHVGGGGGASQITITAAKPPVNMHRTHGGGVAGGQLPPGTAYIMNDLHREEKLSNKEKSATLPGRGKNLSDYSYATEPPLRPEFGGPPHPGSRPPASAGTGGRLQGSADNVYTLSAAAVSGSQGSALRGMQQRCRTTSCDFYGSAATDFLCSSCWKEKQRTLSAYQTQKKYKE